MTNLPKLVTTSPKIVTNSPKIVTKPLKMVTNFVKELKRILVRDFEQLSDLWLTPLTRALQMILTHDAKRFRIPQTSIAHMAISLTVMIELLCAPFSYKERHNKRASDECNVLS